MIGYRLLPGADEEMNKAAVFYELASPGLGQEFLDDLEQAIAMARSRPAIGQTLERGRRRLLLRQFPFSIVYLVEQDAIVVVAVAHQRRRPGYWR